MTTALITNIVLATLVFTTIVGFLGWSIATSSRDRGAIFARRVRRARRAQVRPVRVAADPSS